MQSEMANRVMAMGFSHNHVRQVMKKQIEEFSCAFQTSEALVDALILTPEDLIDFNSDEESNHENQPEATNRQGSKNSLDIFVGKLEIDNGLV